MYCPDARFSCVPRTATRQPDTDGAGYRGGMPARPRGLPGSRPGRRSAARPVRRAESPSGTDGASVECPQDTGGTGESSRQRSFRPPTTPPKPSAGRPSKGTLAGSGRGTFPHFFQKIWKCRSLCLSSRCGGMTSYDFPRGKVSASTPPGALSASLAFCLLRAQKGGTGRPRVAPVPGRKARVPAARPGFRPETKDQP